MQNCLPRYTALLAIWCSPKHCCFLCSLEQFQPLRRKLFQSIFFVPQASRMVHISIRSLFHLLQFHNELHVFHSQCHKVLSTKRFAGSFISILKPLCPPPWPCFCMISEVFSWRNYIVSYKLTVSCIFVHFK